MTGVGIIGCGGISRFHIEGYARAGATLVHMCDVRKEVAEKAAAKFDARTSSDYHAVLDDPKVDLVSVLLPAALHREVCLAAIKAHKGIVCEKTLTDGADTSAEVARAAAGEKVFFATAFMKRHFPAARQAKALLNEMGDIVSLYARSWQPYDVLWDEKLGSEYTTHPSGVVRAYGGGVLVCGGSHILDLIHWFAGRPRQVSGQMKSREGLDFDIQANAMLWLAQGGVAHFEALWHPHRYAGYERNGWDERLEINTAEGRLDFYTVKWDHPENNGALLVHQDAHSGRVTEYRYPAVNPFNIEMAEMLRAFNAGESGSPSAWDGYVVDELIHTITSSADQDGKTLPVVWQDA